MSVTTKFWIGDKVILSGNISAVVTGITITQNSSIEYRCGYFIQGVYYIYWLHDYEITAAEKSTPKVVKFNKEVPQYDNE